MNKRKIKVIAIFLLIVIVLSGVYMSHPLWGSEERVKSRILKETPIGMHMEDVIAVIEGNRKWEIRYIDYENGYYSKGAGPWVGEKSIRVYIGSYKYALLIDVSVTVFWGFDENEILTDVDVWKSPNVL